MSGWEIALIIFTAAISIIAICIIQAIIDEKERKFRRENDEEFLKLLDEFEKKDYRPQPPELYPLKSADEFKLRLIKVFFHKR